MALQDGFITIVHDRDGDPVGVLVGPGTRRTRAIRALRTKFPKLRTTEVSLRDAGAFLRGRG